MKVSIIVPCFNERETIEKVIDAVRSLSLPDGEIIVVDDGSSDGTTAVLKGKIAPIVDHIIYLPRNRGKGAALCAGFVAASGEVIVVQDADLEYDPGDYPILLAPIVSGAADAVFGSRFMSGRPHRVSISGTWSEQIHHPAFEHAHQSQPDRRRDRLQSFPSVGNQNSSFAKTDSGSKWKSRPSWRKRAAAFTRSAFPTAGEPMKKGRK